MAIIRDRTKAKEKIEMALKKHKDKIWWIKIDSVDIPNKHTGRIDHVEDLYIYATVAGAGRPRIICGFKDSRNTYILHEELAHINIGSMYSNNIPDSKTNKFYIREFCNTVKDKDIVDRPEIAKKIIKGNLLDTNPSSPMRSGIKTVRFDCAANILREAGTNNILKNDATLEQIIAGRRDLTDLSETTKEYMKDIRNQLLENKELVYAYVQLSDNISPSYYYTLTTKEELESGKYLTQDYYKTYDYRDVDKDFVIPKTEYDICCIGAGSAGTNMLEQICRLNYFDKYMIVDFDIIEAKNLRNQTYRRADIGRYKAGACDNMIRNTALSSDLVVKSYNQKVEDTKQLETSKTKYLISGFDTIECRKYVLDKIKSGDIETQYLIDARYRDLTSSLFFIDVNNKEEMGYYEKILLDNTEVFEKEKVYDFTLQEIEAQFYDNIHNGGCNRLAKELGLVDEENTFDCVCHGTKIGSFGCGCEECLALIKKHITAKKIENKVRNEGCLAQNIIHIYKLTSTWVTAAIRSIEDNNVKPFTHVDMAVDPIPKEIIIKK